MKVRHLNQLGSPVSIWNCSAVLFAWPDREFRLWSDFGTALIQTPNFSCTEPNYAQIIITYFVSSLTEMSIFRLLNLVHLQLRSASQSVQPVYIIWVSLNSNQVRLMKSSASEPDLSDRKLFLPAASVDFR